MRGGLGTRLWGERQNFCLKRSCTSPRKLMEWSAALTSCRLIAIATTINPWQKLLSQSPRSSLLTGKPPIPSTSRSTRAFAWSSFGAICDPASVYPLPARLQWSWESPAFRFSMPTHSCWRKDISRAAKVRAPLSLTLSPRVSLFVKSPPRNSRRLDQDRGRLRAVGCSCQWNGRPGRVGGVRLACINPHLNTFHSTSGRASSCATREVRA